MRTESDALGELGIPEGALYGIHSLRARNNFAIEGGRTVNLHLVRAVAKVKKAAALVHAELSPGRAAVFRAVASAADEVAAGRADEWFIVPALQGGAGTSLNMNVNEVLANLALLSLGRRPGDYAGVHPLDDVNRGQSTNDVYPTALRIAAIGLLRVLADEAAALQEALQRRENELQDVPKLGRTELMDAVPVTLGGEFGAWAQAIARDRWRLYKMEERLRQVNIGGTAVGLSPLSERRYRFGVIERLREICGIGLASSEYPMDITQNNDVFCEVSGLLKSMAVNLAKIAGDLRLMNSGPAGGLGEIRLEPLQMGSTFMPGKVNPVVPELALSASMKVMANDLAVTVAASRGEFELNAFLPVIAEALLESLEILAGVARIFRLKCIETLSPDPARCRDLLEGSMAFAAAYWPRLGYESVAGIVRASQGDPRRARQALDDALA
ncbi:MAG: aspartate ammonia-lyase, partial [Deltaproteobacteria bacterium]|nr:aspartate ammonia-lyase [Deltaproteobacteria bacterium]